MDNKEEKSLAEELREEPVTDTSTKRSRFNAFTLIFVIAVLAGIVIAALLLFSGSQVAPAIQEATNSAPR